jgi:hypothetical protein
MDLTPAWLDERGLFTIEGARTKGSGPRRRVPGCGAEVQCEDYVGPVFTGPSQRLLPRRYSSSTAAIPTKTSMVPPTMS